MKKAMASYALSLRLQHLSGICGTRTSKCYSSSEEQLSIMKNNYCAMNVSPFMGLKCQKISAWLYFYRQTTY